MRLIDADGLDNHKFSLTPLRYHVGWNDAVSSIVENAPTIDPVHAAGGCYCRECEKCKEWENRHGITGYTCTLLCVDISPDAFCSYGRRKENIDGKEQKRLTLLGRD